ncbi:hypothetical protein M758_7G048800 [Ceratodon purpureus]|uniref:Uncharacterized protein n=1 Tax=Ceratodon purpureus TaxID=3225 RepID=A0A8T0H6D4_CERPU|nr:hypothetical protein KC19_7G051600 [Ceratodon purpureus]KAG0610230.1 hypothetical protein M758_7G048800 [Ceratodon purpureus]
MLAIICVIDFVHLTMTVVRNIFASSQSFELYVGQVVLLSSKALNKSGIFIKCR